MALVNISKFHSKTKLNAESQNSTVLKQYNYLGARDSIHEPVGIFYIQTMLLLPS